MEVLGVVVVVVVQRECHQFKRYVKRRKELRNADGEFSRSI